MLMLVASALDKHVLHYENYTKLTYSNVIYSFWLRRSSTDSVVYVIQDIYGIARSTRSLCLGAREHTVNISEM